MIAVNKQLVVMTTFMEKCEINMESIMKCFSGEVINWNETTADECTKHESTIPRGELSSLPWQYCLQHMHARYTILKFII